MKLLGIYKKANPEKFKLKISYDKKSENRPAWISIKNLPFDVNFIMIHLGKNSQTGRRIQFYKTYLPPGLFLPIDYNSEELRKYYDKMSENYDEKILESLYNVRAGKFLCNKLKEYYKSKKASVLDIGAGTGLITEIYLDAGFKDITLLDFSQGMLNKAKNRKKLQNCKFIKADAKNLNLKKKFDIILSHFSLGSLSYYSENEFDKTLKLIKKHLKEKGLIAILGHFNQEIIGKNFKEINSGIYTLDKKKKFYTDYFLGVK